MKLSRPIGISCSLLALSFSSVAFAQTPAAPASAATASEAGHASGFMVQGRLQTQSSILSLGGPGFLIGYQGKPFALGLQLGLTRVGISQTPQGQPESSASVLLYQLVPTAMFDFWQSADGRARANVIGGVGYGHASISLKDSSQDCVFDPNTGAETCTNTSEEQKVGAGFVPVMLGIGGDYFFGRNFGIGLEGGFQGLFVTGIDNQNNGTTTDVAASANMQFAYGVIRATLVLGD